MSGEKSEQESKSYSLQAIGAGVITVVAAAGTITLVASVLKLLTWVIGGIAGVITALAPWVAVLIGICAYSAYVK